MSISNPLFSELPPHLDCDLSMIDIVVKGVSLDLFTVVYLNAALTFGVLIPEDDLPCDMPPESYGYTLEDFDVLSLKYAINSCRSFIADCKKANLLKEYPYRRAGLDFYLSRYGYKNVFVDRGPTWISLKSRTGLDKISESYGRVCLHEDDGQLALVLGHDS